VRVYVASSWRNEWQPGVVARLREDGHDVYDFRNPSEGDNGFHWSEIDPEWKSWDWQEYLRNLSHPVAQAGFKKDMDALRDAEATVLVMPCGRSAHLEMGYAIGAGQHTAILVHDGEPELMNLMADFLTGSLEELTRFLRNRERAVVDGLQPDLLRVLRDPTITVPQDHEIRLADGRTLFDHLEEWRNAPSNTASTVSFQDDAPASRPSDG